MSTGESVAVAAPAIAGGHRRRHRQPTRPAPTAQDRFLAYVAHELRTPLALQRTLVEVTLADPNPNALALREMGQRVLASCLAQQQLIEALLDLARGNAGLARRRHVELASIAAAALRAHDLDTLESRVSLTPACAAGDPVLLERLAANLVSNAIRHNIAGGRIELATRTEGGRAVLCVTNTGPRIPPGDLPRLFEPFERLTTSGAAAGVGLGLGLGLTIVRAIAEAHGALVTAQARVAGGLRIDVSFPSARPASLDGRPAARATTL